MAETKEKPTPKKISKAKPPVYATPKLGNVNGKPILCGQKCPKCPLLDNGKIQVKHIKSKEGKLINLVCKSMLKALN